MTKIRRTVPKALAPLIERLELDQSEVVTMKQLASMAAEEGVKTAPRLIAHRLRERGWLLSTGLNGVWEFAPGAHAGPHSRGSPLLPVRAAMALRREFQAAVALSSAAWVHGFADRAPARVELAVEPGEGVPAGLRRRVKVLRFHAELDAVERCGVPAQRLETLLVHMAARPAHVSSWGGVREWLEDVVAEATKRGIRAELSDRPNAVRIRLAYLLQGLWPEFAVELGSGASSKVWFGRGKLRRHSQRWRVADSLLPFDPAKLPAVR